jgi:hypothetical protein
MIGISIKEKTLQQAVKIDKNRERLIRFVDIKKFKVR